MIDTAAAMWPQEKRNAMADRINEAARNTAESLGAQGCVIIAFFQDGELMHTQDGGSSPLPFAELYKRMATAWEMMEASGGKDVTVS